MIFLERIDGTILHQAVECELPQNPFPEFNMSRIGES